MKKKIYIALSAFCLLTIGIVLLCHPNDKRLLFQLPKSSKDSSRWEKVFQFFESNSSFQHTLSTKRYKQSLKSLKKKLPHTKVHIDKARYTHDLQFSFGHGQYPYKFSSMDGIFLPRGTYLKFQPQVKEQAILQFFALNLLGKSQLIVKHNGRTVQRVKLKSQVFEPTTDSFFQTKVWSVLFPKDYSEMKFDEINIPINLQDTDSITLSCQGKGCFISEPNLYRTHSQTERPNILMVVIDSMRHDAVNKRDMPQLHKFQQNNLSYAKHMSSANLTVPAVSTIFKGVPADQLGHLPYSYGMKKETANTFYQTLKPSFPSLMKNAGYVTAAIGNLSITSDVYGHSLNHGFSELELYEKPIYETQMITQNAVSWLSRHKHKPFFLYLHYDAPHAPYRPPYHHAYKAFPGLNNLHSTADFLKWFYRGELSLIDDYLGKLLKYLKAANIDQNTLVMITSDHGDHHEVRSFSENTIAPTVKGSYFDHGATLYNDEIQVPMLISYKKHKGTFSNFTSALDIAPTILHAAKIKIPAHFAGKSLFSPALKATADSTRIIPMEFAKAKAIIFANRFKYIKNIKPSDKKILPAHSFLLKKYQRFIPEELYDLQQDPNERSNLAQKNKSLLLQARSHYAKYFKLQTKFSLNIRTPKESALLIKIPKRAITKGSTQPTRYKGEYALYTAVGKELSIRGLKLASNIDLPLVFIDRKQVQLNFTKENLPLRTPLANLPIQATKTLSQATQYVYIDKHHDHSSALPEGLIFSDKSFARILKQWGYLN